MLSFPLSVLFASVMISGVEKARKNPRGTHEKHSGKWQLELKAAFPWVGLHDCLLVYHNGSSLIT